MCISKSKKMLCLIIFWVYKMFNCFAGDGFRCSSALCLFFIISHVSQLETFSCFSLFHLFSAFYYCYNFLHHRWASNSRQNYPLWKVSMKVLRSRSRCWRRASQCGSLSRSLEIRRGGGCRGRLIVSIRSDSSKTGFSPFMINYHCLLLSFSDTSFCLCSWFSVHVDSL